MENQEINENPVVSIKNDLIVLIGGAISLFFLNWYINNYIEIIAGIILVIISGYGLSILFFPKKNEIDFLSRSILSPIFGILLMGFWSILLNYTPYHGTNLYYELAIIPILSLLFIIRTIRFLRAKELFSSTSSKIGPGKSAPSKLKNIKNNRKYDQEYNNLNTAQAAAKAEKEKLRKINKKIGTTESISGYVPPTDNPKTSNNSSKSESSMPRPPSFAKYKKQAQDKKIDNHNSKGKSKTRFAFKSQKNTKTESSKDLEIIKVRKSTKDIILILILTLVSGLFIFLPLNSSTIKIPFTLIILFFVSGYCMLSGLFLNFSEHGLIKKIISSVLLSIVIVSVLASLLIFIKINIPYKYVLGIIVILSLSMGILGYLRKNREHKRVKESFKFDKKYPISEKSEFNVLSVSKSKDSSQELKDNSTEKNVFKKYSLKNAQEKPLQRMNIANKSIPEIKEPAIESKNLDNKNQSIPLKEKTPTMAFDENSSKNLSKKAALSPSDARKIVMSRKKDMEKSGQEKNKSSHIYDELEKDDKLDPKKNLKDISDLPRNLSPLKLIAVIILSIMGIVFTIPAASSISHVVDLVFILPILIYLPGYAIKKLFLPEKYPGIIFTSAISIFISLSLDILILFILLYIGHLLNQTGLNQSLYVGILAIISIICILMAFRISNKRANYASVNDISKKKSEEDELKNIKYDKVLLDMDDSSDRVSLDTDDSFDVKNKDDFGIGILKEDIGLAKKELKKAPSFTINKKSEAKPVRKNYLEEELVKSFSTSDVFDDKSQNQIKSRNINPKDEKLEHGNNKDKKPEITNQNAKKRFIPLDLLIVLLMTFLTILSIYVPILNKTPLNSVLGLLFILFIPGYTLVAALFPKKHDLDNIERLALSFGLSLAISPLIGLALNYTPFGIKLTPIVISLTIFTVIMVLVSYIRRRRVSRENRFNPKITNYLYSWVHSFRSESKLDKILSIILIISLVLAIATTAYIIVKPKEGEKFTEFYILGPNGKASDYPTNLTLGETGKLFVGVVNHEYSTVNYKFVVKLQGKNISTENISLKNNQKWEKLLNFTPDTSGPNQKLELLLYKLPDDKNAYRSLHLWVNVT